MQEARRKVANTSSIKGVNPGGAFREEYAPIIVKDSETLVFY
jgi:hypothetical protein